MFCKYCTQKDLEYIKTIYAEQIELFAHKANDALFKNFAAYDFIVTNKIKGDRCLDIGAGPSALGFLLCDYFEEVNLIDLDVSNNFVHNNLKKELGDFFNFAEKLPVNSFDVIIDACSITHFAYNNERNTGLDKCAIIIEKIIKSNGYFIMTSDVLPPFDMKNTNQKQYLKIDEIIEIFANNNLRLIQPFNYQSYNKEMTVTLNWNNDNNFTLNFANFIFVKDKK